MANVKERIKALRAALAERIVIIDGAAGTSIQEMHLSAADFGGPQLEGCNENLVRTRPERIRAMHRGFLEAGADIIETNSFGATSVVLADYGLGADAREINRIAAELARTEADAASTADRPRWVVGSMGPTTKSISVAGNATFDQLAEAYQEQAEGLIEGGVDVLLLETVMDTLNCKAGLVGIERAIEKTGTPVAVAVSGTIETMGTLLAGQDIEAFYTSIEHHDLIWVGLNCATGPDFMTDHLRTLSELSRWPLACVPNAGLPDEENHYNETPEFLTSKLERMDQPGRRMLRDDPGAYPGADHDGGGAQAARNSERPAQRSLGHRDAGGRRQHTAGDRRRAHQRPRQPQVQAAGGRGQNRRGGGGRAPAGAARGPRARRVFAGPRSQ
jgi:5-methyltetrahydrofolate--homocysteine methyltransferase